MEPTVQTSQPLSDMADQAAEPEGDESTNPSQSTRRFRAVQLQTPDHLVHAATKLFNQGLRQWEHDITANQMKAMAHMLGVVHTTLIGAEYRERLLALKHLQESAGAPVTPPPFSRRSGKTSHSSRLQ